jgi:crotonobetaine/carnitine-CoA ligase
VNNLAELLVLRRAQSAGKRLGLLDAHEPYGAVFDRAAAVAGAFAEAGVRPGGRVAVVGTNSLSYLVTWMALQLAGAETALVNPNYPADLLREMFTDLEPATVVWVGPEPDEQTWPGVRHVDAARADELVLRYDEADHSAADAPAHLPGLDRAPLDIAGYMHTSGTTGTPKFCAQTHEYFLRLGRFIADSMGLSEADTVLAPLPLFHINPLGYGVIGGLVAGADVLSAERFSASGFWPGVRDNGVTAVVLHGPPLEILKRATKSADADGHRLRIMFFADAGFLEQFRVPMGVSAYGSTEAAGLCHVWTWRRGDEPVDLPEGMSRYGGRSRHDVQWTVSDSGEILVRADRPGVLFDGYFKRGTLNAPFDADGWFATGDLGRVDAAGNLVFIERAAESIRVKGEFVPIGFVEDHFAKRTGIQDLAIWREPSELAGSDAVALYVASDLVDVDTIRAARDELPAFMRPSVLVQVKEIPRDAGVGKIRRRSLADTERIETLVLT